MNHIWSIARKELRGYFNSAVALIFLATFLGVVLFTFFWVDKFFTRNIADVRPMFDWLPLLLIFLVGALSMRLWSEEQKVGTIEILLTLPVPHWQLVLGKFLAGLTLVAIALVLTLGLPITVAMMGDLDSGPVIGGYLGALLLASAYLSVGLCVSAATDNQIVSLILTVLVCTLLYLPGAEAVAGIFGTDTAELLRRIGTGSRFNSIARGVVDLRDLAYYGSVVVVFLGLNIVLLKAKGWGHGKRTEKQRFNLRLAVGLVAVNAIALNLWLSPVAAARVDLTKDNEYSLSDVTRDMLQSLDQPLIIRGYFSEKTHPLLAPLVPRIRDLLSEYKVVGGSKVRLEFTDPSESEEVEKEAQEKYGIKSFPFQFADRRERSVVNAYFHILLQYGDQHEVLTFEDLIEVNQDPSATGQIEVKLRNFEYDVTRTVKKLAYGFQSLDALFGALEGKAELTAYITPRTLPENMKTAPASLKKVVDELEGQAHGKLVFRQEEPDTPQAQQALFKRYGMRPYAASLLSGATFYLHFVLKVGSREIPLPTPQEVTEASLKQTIVEGLKRTAPGFIKTVAVWTPPPEQQQPQMPGMPPQRPRAPQGFNTLQEQLRGSYQVEPAELSSGHVQDAVDVLVLAGPAHLGDKEQRAVDQFVMRGGALIVLDGRYRLNLSSQDLQVEPIVTGLEKLFARWGIDVGDRLVMDSRNDVFPIPGERDLGNGVVVREIQQLPYPFFVHVPREAMGDNIMTSRLSAAVMHYASPVRVTAPEDKAAGDKKGDKKKDEAAPARKVEVLMSSSDDSWLQKSPQVQPDFRLYPQTGFGRPQNLTKGDEGAQPLAVAITGSFDSLFAHQPAPKKDAKKGDSKDESERLIERSPPDARVIVVGSSSFVTDELLELSQRAGADYVQNNLELVQNMVDWAVADTDLLSIRSRGTHTRLLEVAPESRGKWESINYGIVILGLGIVVAMSMLRRRTLVPIQLDQRGGGGRDPEPDGGGGGGGGGATDDAKSEKDEEGRP
ncbi:MAG TPA: Gldg family protein [Kofleriaceae bacterium]|nr:Gldg family protein [Kofleriaceae bacterium]